MIISVTVIIIQVIANISVFFYTIRAICIFVVILLLSTNETTNGHGEITERKREAETKANAVRQRESVP